MSIHVFAPDGRSLLTNGAWDELWDLDEGEAPESANIFEDARVRAAGLAPYIEDSVAGLRPVATPPLFYDPARSGHGGRPRWLQASIYPVQDESGRLLEMALVIEDVTGRRWAEEALKESEERHRRLVESSPETIAVLSEGKIVFINTAGVRLAGADGPEDLLGKPYLDFVHPDFREAVESRLLRVQKGESVELLQEKLLRPDGSAVEVEATTIPTIYEGKPAVQSLIRDITGRKEAETKLRKSEASLAEAQRMAHLGSWEWDVVTGKISWSEEVYRIYGYTPGEFVPTVDRLMEIIHPDDRELVRKNIDDALYEYKPYDFEHRIVRPDGTERVVHRRAEVVFDEEGGPRRMIGAIHDITGRRKAEEALRESEERFRGAFEDAPIGVALVGLDGRRFRVNRALCEMLGYSEEELLGRNYLETVHPEDREISAESLRRTLKEGAGSYTLERRYVHADGHAVWNLSSVSLICDSRGKPSHLVCLHQDITERKALEEQLEHQAFHDTLTGFPNRALFMDRLEQALARLDRREEPIAVLFMDLDNFKIVNDSLGHEVGDRLLVAVAGRLKECVRPEDTVARFGGDEFAVLLEGITDLNGATRIAARITGALKTPFNFEGREVFAGVSVGIALATQAPDEPEGLLRNADLALYGAKKEGKARYEVFDASMGVEALERLKLESALRRALERGEFRIYYQPTLSISTGRISSMEALIRWEHPERGLLEPDEFLPVAEESGLIVQIGEWIIDEVCRQGWEWQERFADGSPPGVCMNVSARQLSQTDFTGKVTESLHSSGLRAQGLSLEIPEGVLMDAAEANAGKLEALRALGVDIVIDDFGTAYSSLSHLRRLPLNFLKIDRSLVVKLGEEREDRAIVSAVIKLAKALGWEVVAQGVETDEQLALLREMGCDTVQGYYFSRPVTSEEATALLEANLSTAGS